MLEHIMYEERLRAGFVEPEEKAKGRSYCCRKLSDGTLQRRWSQTLLVGAQW